jgi:signal transduction histidine kinase
VNPPRPEAEPDPVPARGILLPWLAIVLAIGFLMFSYHYLAYPAAGRQVNWLEPFINEFSSVLSGGLLFFPIRALVYRRPLDRGGWAARLPLYLAAALATSCALTSMRWGLRTLAYPPAGLGPYDYGVMPTRYFMELPVDLQGFAIMVVLIHGWRHVRRARAQEVRTARLEAGLARAELRNLRLQLQPHFLFNALNTISARMYDDPRGADEMLDRLAELLRVSLRTAERDELPLDEELDVLASYLALMHARFGDRLAVTLAIDPQARRALVPSLLLQPLVENAVRHGNAERVGRGAIAIAARRDGARLELAVEDDGPGTAGAAGDLPETLGVGLGATRERLQLLYGDDHAFAAGNRPGGGFRVALDLPFRTRAGEAP